MSCCDKDGEWYGQCGLNSRHSFKEGWMACNSKSVKQFHVVVPGHGSPKRSKAMMNTIRRLRVNIPVHTLFSCSIYVYNLSLNLPSNICEIHHRRGFWTDFMQIVEPKYDYIGLLMDDVYVENNDMNSFFKLMDVYDVDVAAAALPNWHWHIMKKRDDCLLRRTRYTDMLFTVFKKSAFVCWQNQINTTLNRMGWGYDLTFKRSCSVNIAILDTHTAIHMSGERRGQDRLYDEKYAFEDMWNWLSARNFESVSHFNTQDHKMKELINYINKSEIECIPEPLLGLADSSYYSSVEHQGGWRSVVSFMLKQKTLTLGQAKYSFIDCCESFFMWERRRISTPWLGIIHFSHNLPNFFPKFETAQALVENSNFLKSLKSCKALIVLSKDMSTWLQSRLSVPVFALRHPIVEQNCSDTYNTHKKSVLLLGSQYRRISSIFNLSTHLEKVWMPGTRDNTRIKQLIKRDPYVSQSPPSESVNIMYTGSPSEYQSLLSNSYVVIDMWDSSANNAVLESIYCNIPAIVTRLPSTVEYLGEDYPLFARDYNDLTMFFKNTTLLDTLLSKARTYLQRTKLEQTTISQFQSQIVDIVRSFARKTNMK